MTTQKRKVNKGFLVFNKGERIAIITLLSIIVIFLGFSIFRPMIHLSNNDQEAFRRLDSLLAMQKTALSQQEWQETKTHGKDATDLASKEPIPTKSKPKQDIKKAKDNSIVFSKNVSDKPTSNRSPIDLNKADSTELLVLPQIGATMASRIQRYRNRLGGFVALQQLFEIKGMDTARFETIRPLILIGDSDLQTINVNQDDFKTLLRHPYLEYDQVKAIVNHREHRGLIKNWEQLKGIIGEVNPLLERYLIY